MLKNLPHDIFLDNGDLSRMLFRYIELCTKSNAKRGFSLAPLVSLILPGEITILWQHEQNWGTLHRT